MYKIDRKKGGGGVQKSFSRTDPSYYFILTDYCINHNVKQKLSVSLFILLPIISEVHNNKPSKEILPFKLLNVDFKDIS